MNYDNNKPPEIQDPEPRPDHDPIKADQCADCQSAEKNLIVLIGRLENSECCMQLRVRLMELVNLLPDKQRILDGLKEIDEIKNDCATIVSEIEGLKVQDVPMSEKIRVVKKAILLDARRMRSRLVEDRLEDLLRNLDHDEYFFFNSHNLDHLKLIAAILGQEKVIAILHTIRGMEGLTPDELSALGNLLCDYC